MVGGGFSQGWLPERSLVLRELPPYSCGVRVMLRPLCQGPFTHRSNWDTCAGLTPREQVSLERR